MPLWTLEKPPTWREKEELESVGTNRGWEDPKGHLHEVLVAIPNLASRAAEANVLSAKFEQAAYLQGDALKVVVRYSEYVNVSAGATLIASWDGPFGNITLTAAAQSAVNEVAFDGVVPAEAGNLSIAAQSVVGTVLDANDGVTPSELTIVPDVALAAGVIAVA
jgi:hypothetical protein